MARWKEDRYYKDELLGAAGTMHKELPPSGQLSAIRLELYCANANAIQNASKARIIDHITKVEITDGGTNALFSLTGQEVRALNFFDNGFVPYEKAALYGNSTQRTDMIIPFGLKWKDRDYLLDLSQYDSLWLDITNDATTSHWATTALKMNMFLLTLQDEPSVPAKFIKNYEWRSGKPAAAGQHVYHELPTLDMIKRVMVQLDPDLGSAGSPTNDPKGDSHVLKYTYLQDKEVILDHRPRDIARMNVFDYGMPVTQGWYYQSTSQYMDLAIMDITNAQAVHKGTALTGTAISAVMEGSNDRFQKLANVASGTTVPEQLDIRATGAGYYHCLVLEDHPGEPEATWLNPRKESGAKGPVRIDWNGYTADHTVRTCLQVAIEQGKF